MDRCRFLDCFCYVCGHIVPKKDRHERKNLLNEDFMKVYKKYFPNEMNLANEAFTPNTVCSTCYTQLLSWAKNDKKYLNFMTPAMWMEDYEGHDESR